MSMSDAPQLTPTSYVVLGCIASCGGAATPYELKTMIGESIADFWSFPHSQLYTEPERLTGLGLLSEDREEGGRRRRRFTITDAGREVLESWLVEPTAELPEIRDVALLKVFFADQGDLSSLVELARVQRAAHAERVAHYEELESGLGGTAVGAAVRLGLAWERAAVAYWAELEENPPTASG